MRPPAPARFSMMNCCPRSLASEGEMSRVTKSSPPPGVVATTMRTGFSGHLPDWAWTAETAAESNAADSQTDVFIMDASLGEVGCSAGKYRPYRGQMPTGARSHHLNLVRPHDEL